MSTIAILLGMNLNDWPVGRTEMHLSLKWKVLGSNLGPVKSDTDQRLAIAVTFQKELCCSSTMTRRWAPHSRYTLPHDTMGIMKDLIC